MSTATVHPFDPATAEEISSAANAIKTLYSGIQLHFKSAGLDEPPKHAMLEFLDAEHQGRPLPLVPRCIFLMWYIKRTPRLFEGIVDVTHGKVVYHKELPRDFHGPVDRIELTEAAQAVMADEGVQKEIQRLKLDNTTVVLDPWDYGVDGLETQERHTQVFMYMRNPRNNDSDSNHYAFPLDFMVIVDLSTMKVKRIVRLPLGMTLHNLSFDGKSNFYRLSLSEMFVPYGDPRNPIYRKGAFDLGNVGAGVTANNLQLGCDCLGMIKYIDGCVISPDGTPAPRPNAICIHEVDNGIQWKHTNHRTGKAVVVRKRQLVLQTIITVANYEYIFAWYFDQSGELTFETRATGILSTQPIAADVKVPWGTRVADGVMAPYHQHLFNLRIDPAVGGHRNSFAATDSVAMPWDEQLNPLGTGYVTEETIVQRAGPVSDSVSRGRVFKILNESTTNRVSLTPIGYKLVPHRSQMLLAHAGTWHARRSEFATHPIWVTPYADRQLFPAGDYTNQGLGGHGIASWLDPESPYRRDRPRDDAAPGRAPVRDADIVVWHTYGLTHNPRVEDFPVMPAEIVQVHLKPFNFCEFNPANDVPPSTQDKNRSQEYQPPAEKGDAVAQGKVCCQSNL
ncbi:putative copper amine oxidase protein [Neofusicoccum parvum UCRNP2]|uniref:Amine oxidase n=1 Tax=Botryosphaeria parva (strain UCR-NP2) TaxID=1287680 RepID=R1GB76_BOTPV|nr:putative copper amine oxidase protein [Neofusicoccum parvum UCRNP2]